MPPAEGFTKKKMVASEQGDLSYTPRIGQLDSEAIMSASRKELLQIAKKRFGLGEEDLLSAQALERLNKQRARLWTKESILQIAILCLDGKPFAEITDAMDAARNTEHGALTDKTVQTMLSTTLSAKAKKIGVRNSYVRKRNEFFFPSRESMEREVREIEAFFSLPRERIFHFPKKELAYRSTVRDAASLYDPEIAIKAIYLRFCKKVQGPELIERLSIPLERTISSENLGTFFSNSLSKEAKDRVQIKTRGLPKAAVKGAYAEVGVTKAGMVLPDPPIGQLPVGEVLRADEKKLVELCEKRYGLSPQDILDESAAQVREHHFVGEMLAWTKQDRMRMGILYLDGRSHEEIAAAFEAARPSGKNGVTPETVNTIGGRSLSPFAKQLARANRLVRKRHAFLHPENAGVEKKLREIELTFGIGRERMFHLPFRRQDGEHTQTVLRAVSIYNAEIAVPLVYARYFEKKGMPEVVDLASELTGRPVSQSSVYVMFSTLLTKEAKARLKSP